MAEIGLLKDVLDKTKDIAPVGEHNGVKITSFEEQRDLAQLDILENRGLDTVQMNPDGTVARTPVRVAAVNLDNYYINRYRKVKDSLYVVTDYRAIQEQPTGNVYAKQVPAFVVSRGEDGNLKLDKVVTVSDAEFVTNFTHSLNREAMAQIMPLLVAGVGVSSDDLGI